MDNTHPNIQPFLPSSLSKTETELALNNLRDTLYRVDKTGEITFISSACKELTGFSVEELIDSNIFSLYRHPYHRVDLLHKLQENNGKINNYEVELTHKDGHHIWAILNAQSIIKDGQLVGIEGLISNITKRKKIERNLHREKEKAQATLRSIVDGVITTDIEGRIEYLNPMAENLTGYSLHSALGKDVSEVFCPKADDGDDNYHDHPVHACLKSGESITVPNIRILTRPHDHQQFDIHETSSPIRNNKNEIIGAVLVFHDATEIRLMSQKLSYQASHDSHTGLINRRAFEALLKIAISKAQENDSHHVFCYLDLDQFKVVNDTCGHIAGDALLTQLTSILHGLVREKDTFARIGGDEFGILIENCILSRGVEIAEKIRLAINDFRFSWENKIFEVGVSIGLVTINKDTQNITEVLSTADAACYIAKDRGRNRIHVSKKDDTAINLRHQEMSWSHRIKHALENDSFTLFNQHVHPVDPDSTQPIYCESLIRLTENNIIIKPMAFIPAAERYNLMIHIDRWVVSQVMKNLQQVKSEASHNKIFALNLSGSSLTDKTFLSFILSQLKDTGVAAESICFEITETAAISNMDQAKRFMQILGGVGFKFALDDFGSGLSSFNYLKHLPVDYLKIDGGIVRDVHTNNVNKAMVESINKIGHVMKLKTIAEFVENEGIHNSLKDIGIDYAQGYYVHKPEPFGSCL